MPSSLQNKVDDRQNKQNQCQIFEGKRKLNGVAFFIIEGFTKDIENISLSVRIYLGKYMVQL